MKHFILILTIMTTTLMNAQNEKASTVKKTFNRTTTVSTEIKAEPSIIWALLTNAADYTRWNTTVTSIEGRIALGETVKIKSILDAKRVFKLKVKEFEPEKRLVWGDGQGKRVYSLTKKENGIVVFSMTEKIGGLMFPMYAKYIPPFDQVFDQLAADLKKEAEKINTTK